MLLYKILLYIALPFSLILLNIFLHLSSCPQINVSVSAKGSFFIDPLTPFTIALPESAKIAFPSLDSPF